MFVRHSNNGLRAQQIFFLLNGDITLFFLVNKTQGLLTRRTTSFLIDHGINLELVKNNYLRLFKASNYAALLKYLPGGTIAVASVRNTLPFGLLQNIILDIDNNAYAFLGCLHTPTTQFFSASNLRDIAKNTKKLCLVSLLQTTTKKIPLILRFMSVNFLKT